MKEISASARGVMILLLGDPVHETHPPTFNIMHPALLKAPLRIIMLARLGRTRLAVLRRQLDARRLVHLAPNIATKRVGADKDWAEMCKSSNRKGIEVCESSDGRG